MKKLGLFLFALGVSASASFAFAGGGEPECYAACDDGLDACMLAHPTSTGACTKIMSICYAQCDKNAQI